MHRQQDPQVETKGKVLRFPSLGAGHAATASHIARVNAAHALQRREQRAAAWIGGAWVLLAWIVAVCRLHLAITQHQVFGAEASMAFLVAVLLPLMRARSIAAAARDALVALRRAWSARRDAPPDGSDKQSPLPSERRSGRPLQ